MIYNCFKNHFVFSLIMLRLHVVMGIFGKIFISAVNKENLIKLKEVIYKSVRDIHVSRFPYNNFLYPEGLDQY